MPQFDIQKRRLFRRIAAQPVDNLRPPWSLDEYQFIEKCTQCQACLNQCPEKILIADRHGYPMVNFQLGECTFCEKCLDVCDTGAITPQSEPWQVTTKVKNSCLAQQQVVCRSCAEICEQDAIIFSYTLGSMAKPKINDESCNGCGACIAICPTNALSVEYLSTETIDGR